MGAGQFKRTLLVAYPIGMGGMTTAKLTATV